MAPLQQRKREFACCDKACAYCLLPCLPQVYHVTGEYEAALACLLRAEPGAAFEYADAHLAEPNCAPGLRSAVLVRPQLSQCMGCGHGALLCNLRYYVVEPKSLPRL